MTIAPRDQTCFFSGHRIIRKADIPELEKQLDLTIRRLAFRGYTDFICGGALGFDTLAALKVLEAGRRGGGPRLILALPCPEQTSRWRDPADVGLYEEIKRQAAGVAVVADSYRDGVMMERNRFMADNSSVCVAYYDGRKSGGASYTVEYARKSGIEIINLLPLVRENVGKDG